MFKKQSKNHMSPKVLMLAGIAMFGIQYVFDMETTIGLIIAATLGLSGFIFFIVGLITIIESYFRRIKKFSVEKENEIDSGNYCTQCGFENSKQSNFCKKCGHKLK